MSGRCGNRAGAFLRYSKACQRLIINKNGRKISLINPKTKKIELKMGVSFGEQIFDFRVFREEKEQRVAALTENGFIAVYSLGCGQKRGEISHLQLELNEEERERPVSLAVSCTKKKLVYVLVELQAVGFRSKMKLFKITKKGLIIIAGIEHCCRKIGSKLALEFLSDFGSHLLWVGLSSRKKGVAIVIDFNTETGELKRLGYAGGRSREKYPYKMVRFGDKLYYTGKYGRVVSLSLNLKS